MHTHLTTSPQEAAAYLRAGDLVAFPTETVYGLGADTFNADAVVTIFTARWRLNTTKGWAQAQPLFHFLMGSRLGHLQRSL